VSILLGKNNGIATIFWNSQISTWHDIISWEWWQPIHASDSSFLRLVMFNLHTYNKMWNVNKLAHAGPSAWVEICWCTCLQTEFQKVRILGSRIPDIILEKSRHFCLRQEIEIFDLFCLLRMIKKLMEIDHKWMNKGLKTIFIKKIILIWELFTEIGNSVCKVTCKHHRSFGTLGKLLKIHPFFRQKLT
jgi:hypothetical protein